MKKIGIFLGFLLALFLAGAFLLPFLIDVDKYRPKIVDAANRQIHGKLELGHLSLSLWGQIRVEVAGLKLIDSRGKEALTVKEAYFHLPLLSLLSGSPALTFKMDHPIVNVFKDHSGHLNWMTLVQEEPKNESPGFHSLPSAPPTSALPSPAPSPSAPLPPSLISMDLPRIVTQARLGIELSHARISYWDQSPSQTASSATRRAIEIGDLNLKVEDISLSHPTELRIWADLDTRFGELLSMKGPFWLSAKAQAEMREGKWLGLSVSAELNLDSVEMEASHFFRKKKGVPSRVELLLSANQEVAKIEKFKLQFLNAQVNGQGEISHLAESASHPRSPVVRFKVDSNLIEFKPWVGFIPMLNAYDLGGSAQLEAEVTGPSDHLAYRAKLSLNQVTAQLPQLKSRPQIDGVFNVTTDQIESFLLTLRAPSSDLKLKGRLVSFSKPKLDMTVTSAGLDLDSWVNFLSPSPTSSSAKGAPPANSPPAAVSPASAEDRDALLNPLRESPMAAVFSAKVGVDLKSLQAKGILLNDVQCTIDWRDLTLDLSGCGFRVFSGTLQSNLQLQMKPKIPLYHLGFQVKGLDLNRVIQAQMTAFKNTLKGIASFNFTASGASLNSDLAMSKLKAQGRFQVDQAEFLTLDVMKMVQDSISKSMAPLAEKIPSLKGKDLVNLPPGSALYQQVSSDLRVEEASFSAPNFSAKAAANRGLDMKGTVTVGMKDLSLSAFLDVIDTFNLTHLADVSIHEGGIDIDHLFVEGNAPVHFPIHVGCTIEAPCYSSTEVPIALGKIALNRVSRALSAHAQQELKGKAESLIQKVVPPDVQNRLKSLFGH